MKKHLIWTDDICMDDWNDFLLEEHPEVTDDYEKYNLVCDMNYTYLEDERMNLNVKLPTNIIIIADLGLWDGRKTAYKELNSNNISDCLYSECDYSEWYIDSYKNLRSKQVHHDGTNCLLYRRWKDNITDEQKENFLNKIYFGKVTKKDITHYTKSIGNEVCKVYGWE